MPRDTPGDARGHELPEARLTCVKQSPDVQDPDVAHRKNCYQRPDLIAVGLDVKMLSPTGVHACCQLGRRKMCALYPLAAAHTVRSCAMCA